jgi:hypothetical protein
MDDPLFVGRFQAFGDLSCNQQRFGDRNGPLRKAIGQRRPLDELQHERLHSVRFLEAVDGGDVRMIE